MPQCPNAQDLIVVMAGYADRMASFYNNIPGLNSRIGNHIESSNPNPNPNLNPSPNPNPTPYPNPNPNPNQATTSSSPTTRRTS